MKELTGQIQSWDEASQRGEIEGDDGRSYSFTSEEWTENEQPKIQGGVLVISQNGREASQVKHLRIMRVSGVRILGKFKRFGSLEIQELGADELISEVVEIEKAQVTERAYPPGITNRR